MSAFLTHGNGDLYFAVLGSGSTYYTPQVWEGLISSEMEDESENEIFYADDINYASLGGAKSRKVTIKVAQIPKNAQQFICGKKIDTNGMMTPTAAKKRVALMFCEKMVDVDSGEESRKLHIFYNCILNGQPKFETETNEDKASVSEIELEFTAVNNDNIKDSEDNGVGYVVINESPTTQDIFDNLGKSVYVPTY